MSTSALEARIALRAGPLLAAFNAAAVLSSADVQVARRLGRLAGEPDERVLLAVALAVRGVRAGSVCVELDDLDALAVPEAEDALPADDLPWPAQDAWVAAIAGSPLVAVGPVGPVDRPVRWVDGRLYLDRYWRHEQAVRVAVDDRLAAGPTPLDRTRLAAEVRRLFPSEQDGRQRLAAATAALSRLTVLTGGPGTGKTTTVARLLAVLQSVDGPLRVALAAPTGKAAARLQQAVQAVVAALPDEQDRLRVGTLDATTVHRLLGWRPGSSTRFRHDRDHHLPHDVVVVDETSMVSLPLMARLLEALRPQARLVLVGDPDQLASVEAGAVLGDLVARPHASNDLPAAVRAVLPDDLKADPPQGPSSGQGEHVADGTAVSASAGSAAAALAALRGGVVRLERVHRHGAEIGRLATAIREGRADDVLTLLRAGGPTVSFVETSGDRPTEADVAGVRADAVDAGRELVAAARDGDVAAALQALERHRLLLAHRRGPAGVAFWAAQVEAWVADASPPDHGSGHDAAHDSAYDPGRGSGPGSGHDPGRGSGHDFGHGPWYLGRPLLVTTNDRDTGLYNGDTGVVVADGGGGVVAVFGDPERPLAVRPHRLPSVETVHAMTVHRGQGSQFLTVSLLLPPETSPLLTRELLYTAVTRAQQRVRVVGTEAAVRMAVERPIRRASGLRHPLS